MLFKAKVYWKTGVNTRSFFCGCYLNPGLCLSCLFRSLLTGASAVDVALQLSSFRSLVPFHFSTFQSVFSVFVVTSKKADLNRNKIYQNETVDSKEMVSSRLLHHCFSLLTLDPAFSSLIFYREEESGTCSFMKVGL